MNNLIKEGRQKAIELLKSNSTAYGILASAVQPRAKARNYLSIFARDSSICLLGMVVSKEKTLISTAKKSLITLGKYQAANGQIPNYVKPESGYTDFWYVGCIDSTLWWLIAIKFFDEQAGEKVKLEKLLAKKIKLAINWLLCQEHNHFKLLSQNEASDWADIMPRSGFVLYTNALWYWVKKEYDLVGARETKESFNYVFYPWQKVAKSYFKKNKHVERIIKTAQQQVKKQDNFLSFVNYLFYGEEVDVLGNLLAILSGVADKKIEKVIIKSFIERKASHPWPIKSVLVPITEGSKNWRNYMAWLNQNYPMQYHNGGIWPFIGGFWIKALNKSGGKEYAKQELARLAELNSQNNWGFNEWFHGETGKPMGMTGQSWSAAMYLFASEMNKKL